jgi:anti-anti-sigma regulatory factor
VLNFSGVPEILEELDPALVRLQGNIRISGKRLVVCGLTPALKKRFQESGIIRSSETAGSLVEALQKIVSAAEKK